MKLKLSGLIILMALTALAEAIQVPVLWQNPKDTQIRKLGFYQAADKNVWAIELAGLKKLANAEKFTVQIYLDTDGNPETGHEKSGWDFRFTVNVKDGSLKAQQWLERTRMPIPLYVDDYQIDIIDSVLYVAIRREPMDRIAFSPRFSIRCVVYVDGKMADATNQWLDQGKSAGHFKPSWNFIRFGEGREVLEKVSEAVLISRGDDLKVWNSFGERYEENEPMPKIIGQDTALRIKGAKGEAEAAFFAVTAEKPLKSFIVAVPKDLSGPDGARLSTENIEVKYLGFVSSVREDSYTDILLPQFKPQKSLHNFAVVEIRIPADATAGIYRGEITLSVDGQPAAPVPLELEVYNFRMPERPVFDAVYSIINRGIPQYYYPLKKDPGFRREFEANMELAWKYRFDPRFRAKPKRTVRTDILELDWKDFDREAAAHFKEKGGRVFGDSTLKIGTHGDYNSYFQRVMRQEGKIGEPEFDRFYRELVGKLVEHYRQLGILGNTVFIIWDEPYEAQYDDINRACRIIREAAPGVPIGVYISTIPPQLEKNIDVWFTKFEAAAKAKLDPAGRDLRIACYNDVGMAFFNTPASIPRQYYWLAYRYNIEQYFYSEINSYQRPYQGRNPGAIYNSWINHIWMYPGTNPGETMPSLRMILSRDGLDDYDYLALYRSLTNNRELPPEIAAAFPTFKPDGKIIWGVKSNRELQEFRDRLARLIVNTAGH